MRADMRRMFMNHHEFLFDRVFSEQSGNQEVYGEAASPLVRVAADGGFATCLMYGQTGSGKTVAMGLVLGEELAEDTRSQANGPLALIVAPTRELAAQIQSELTWLYEEMPKLKVAVVTGGTDISRERRVLSKRPQILVGTHGRLLDHARNRALNLSEIQHVVLDEADQMLDIGFADAIRSILRHVPHNRQTLLFSATMPQTIRRLARTYLRRPEWVLIGGESEPVEQVRQLYFEVAERDRYRAMEELLQEPSEVKQALVFRRTKIGVDHLVAFLRRRGHNVGSIHSDLSQAQRDGVMRHFRSNKLRILVATNIVARGLDIPAVSHVINYDIPDNLEEYVHRIGRTARMGRTGTAITFVSEWDFEMLEAIKSHVGNQLKAEHLGLYGAIKPS